MPDWLAILLVWVIAIACIAIAYFAGRWFLNSQDDGF